MVPRGICGRLARRACLDFAGTLGNNRFMFTMTNIAGFLFRVCPIAGR